MTTLQLPRKHEWQDLKPEYGKFVVEPFEPGFGLTVGNAFRRVLLSSIEGAAPTWVKIENVLHEFSYLPGMMEDTLDVLNNIRRIVFKLHGERSRLIQLRSPGPGVVKASAPVYVAVKPDYDKLLRAVGDSLSGSVIRDDALIVCGSWSMIYGHPPRAELRVREA